MRQNTKRLIGMLIALIILVAALIFFFDYVKPAYQTVQDLKAQLLAQQQFSSTENTDVTNAQNLIAQYKQESSTIASLSAAMPSGKDLAGAVAQIYGAASQNNLAVQSIGITTPSVAASTVRSSNAPQTAAQLVKPLGTIILQINGTGTYGNFKLFLAQLENNIRLFDVKAISLQPATQSSGKNTQDFFTYSISATTYYQSQ